MSSTDLDLIALQDEEFIRLFFKGKADTRPYDSKVYDACFMIKEIVEEKTLWRTCNENLGWRIINTAEIMYRFFQTVDDSSYRSKLNEFRFLGSLNDAKINEWINICYKVYLYLK